MSYIILDFKEACNLSYYFISKHFQTLDSKKYHSKFSTNFELTVCFENICNTAREGGSHTALENLCQES